MPYRLVLALGNNFLDISSLECNASVQPHNPADNLNIGEIKDLTNFWDSFIESAAWTNKGTHN
jgi:hypothetical protein